MHAQREPRTRLAEALYVSRTPSVAMGTSVSKPSPTPRLKASESETNDPQGGATEPPQPDHQPSPLTNSISRVEVKEKGKGKGKKRSNKNNPAIAPGGREVKRLAKTDATGNTPQTTPAAANPAAATTAAAATSADDDTPPAPGKWTYEAMAPFLRSEGWNCADGDGFHTWYFVSRAADGTKNVDYLVSTKEVVDYVRGDEGVLSRYEAYWRRGHAAVAAAAGTGSSKQDGGGGAAAQGGRVTEGAHTPEVKAGGGLRRVGACGASSPAAGRLSKGTASGRAGSRASTRIARRLKEATSAAGTTEASTKRGPSLTGVPIVGVAGTSTGSEGRAAKEASIKRDRSLAGVVIVGVAGRSTESDGRSAKDTPTLRATRASARVGRSARYNSLFKPRSAMTESGSPTKPSPISKTPSSSPTGVGQAAKDKNAVEEKLEPMTESGRPAKETPAKQRAAGPSASVVALGGPVTHSAVVREAVEAAERAAGLGFPAVKQRAQRGLPQTPPGMTVDWAGRGKAKAPTTTTPPPAPAATSSRTEVRDRRPAAEETMDRSTSAPAPQKHLWGGWAGPAHPQAGGPKDHAGPLGYRRRFREPVSWAQSWRETWPTLREEGWHWEYGNDLGATCVYLKPGVSRKAATLGVDMFDSKRAVVQHVLDSKRAAAAAGATSESAGTPADGSGCASVDKLCVDEGARASREQPRLGDAKPPPRLGDNDRETGHKLHTGAPIHVPVFTSRNAGADGESAHGSHAKTQAAVGVVSDGGASPTVSLPASSGNDNERSGGCDNISGSPVEQPARADDEGNQKKGASERCVSNPKDAAAPSRAERGQVGCVPGPSSQSRAGMRNQQRQEAVGREDAPGGTEDDIELAASVVMEMLRVERTDAAEPAAKRRAGLSARGNKLGTVDAGAAPWGVDKLTAHCCEQLVALSELGGASGGVAGKPDGGGGVDSLADAGSCSGGDATDGVVKPILKRKAASSKTSQDSDFGSSESKKMKDGGAAPAVEKKDNGAAGSPTTFRLPGPLSGVGVVVAGVKRHPRLDIEAEITRLRGEVVDVFSDDGVASKWRAFLLGEDVQAAGGGSAASKEGDGGSVGPTACKMISVASPGSDRTPEFQLAVAAGIPIVHPSYLDECSRKGAKVDTAGYLMPFGRSALGSRGLIMRSRSGRERPFQGKTVILCVDDLAATDETAVEKWVLIFGVAGAAVKALQDDRGRVGAASAAGTKGREEGENRCTLQGARQLLAEGRVHCVVGPSMDGASPASAPSAVAAVLQAAVDAGTLTGTLEWAAQCMAHGCLLLPSAETCPWFPVAGVVAAGGPAGRTTSTTAPCGGGGGGAPKTEFECSAGVGGGGAGVFHVHVSNGRRYVAGDYVFLGSHPEISSHHVGGEGVAGTGAGKGGVGTPRDYGHTGSPPLVARVVSFRRETDGAVRVAVDVLGRGEDPKVLLATSAAKGGDDEQQEVGEGMLGGRVLVLTSREAEAARLCSAKDSGIFYLGD